MRVFATAFVVLVAPGPAVAQQGATCVQGVGTTNNCYKLYQPAASPRGLVVLLPGFGDTIDFFDHFQLPRLMQERGYLIAALSMAGYVTWRQDIATLHTVISRIVKDNRIPPDSLTIVGFSAGGTGAIRYAEYCIEHRCPPDVRAAAAVSVDGPLDFERWYDCAARKADRQPDNPAGAMIVKMLTNNLGGPPAQRRTAYSEAAPLSITRPNGGNARLLKDTPVRTYSEPDIGWTIENWGNDYYCLNAIDQAALAQELRFLGNQSAEFVTTTGKGYRTQLNSATGKYEKGERSPHSWSIVDERDLADWIERHTGFKARIP